MSDATDHEPGLEETEVDNPDGGHDCSCGEYSAMDSCENLQAKLQCDSIYFSQFAPLIRHDKQHCQHDPVPLPTCEHKTKIGKIAANPKAFWGAIKALEIGLHPETLRQGLPAKTVKAAIRRAGSKIAPPKNGKAAPALLRMNAEIRAELRSSASAISLAKGKPAPRLFGSRRLGSLFGGLGNSSVASGPVISVGPDFGGLPNLQDYFKDLLDLLPTPPAAPQAPTLGFAIRYRQEWCSQGYGRGRLLRSIPLAADSQLQINIKSWEIRKTRREMNEAVERDISSEIVGDEKWSLATAKQTNTEIGANANGNLKASGAVPIEGVPVNLEGGGGGDLNASVKTQITATEEQVHQATVKSANSLKTKRTTIVEASDEIGFETATSETIRNPNKCNTLTYHYFEITEAYEITTKVERIDPVVFVRLPGLKIDIDWLLCNECLLRAHLPCEAFYQGFDAAKLIKSKRLLGEFDGRLDSAANNQMIGGVLAKIKALAETYTELSSANPLSTAPAEQAGEDLGEFVADKGEDLDDLFNEINVFNFPETGPAFLDALTDFLTELMEKVAEGLGDAVSAVGAAIEATPKAIYWQIVGIAAPELIGAMATLAAQYEFLASLPADPQRTNAIIGAVEAFFLQLGDVTEVFLRIEQAIGVVFVVAAAGGGYGAIAAAGIAISLLSSGGIGVLVGLGGALGAGVLALSEVLSINGSLKSQVFGLYGQAQLAGDQLDLPIPPLSDDPALWAVYQQQLREARERRQLLAEAQVELDRLLCHIRTHRNYYQQLYWLSLESADLQRRLTSDYYIEPGLVHYVIEGFDGDRAAFKVNDIGLLAELLAQTNVSLSEVFDEFKAETLMDGQGKTDCIEVPTRGVTVEPELGQCHACDDFIEQHRGLDIELKQQEVRQAVAETARLEARVANGNLDDPTPFESAKNLTVETKEP